MIYMRFGTPCTIISSHGEHQPKGFHFPMTLVKVRREDDGTERFYFPGFLKADHGIDEITTAVEAVPQVALTPKELRAAVREAM